jgi:aminoglycoside phosphotransferase family enzyme
MGLKKLAKKVADYNERLERGAASKIKPGHVEEVLRKLRKKAADLETELSSEQDSDRKARLERKLQIAREHIERAEWLLNEVD